jgi:hypothetical protein
LAYNYIVVFLLGLFGAFLKELLPLYQIRKEKIRPDWIKSQFYWSISILFILIGGLIPAGLLFLEGGVLHSKKGYIDSIWYGATTPLLLEIFFNESKFDRKIN